jgi:DNA-binding beta-propeller fold protein YncE
MRDLESRDVRLAAIDHGGSPRVSASGASAAEGVVPSSARPKACLSTTIVSPLALAEAPMRAPSTRVVSSRVPRRLIPAAASVRAWRLEKIWCQARTTALARATAPGQATAPARTPGAAIGVRRSVLATAMTLCATIGALVLCGAPAQAAIRHSFQSQITEAKGGRFSEMLCGVAIDPASQDLYVADPGANAIDVFDSADAFQSEINGVSIPTGPFSAFACNSAVDDTTGDVYVADSGTDVVYVFDALGSWIATLNGSGAPVEGETTAGKTPQGSFGGGYVHVATDPASGDVYVADSGDGVVDRFNSANEYQSQLTGLPEAWGVATDSSGRVYVAESGSGGVFEFDSSGSQIAQITGTPGGAFTDLTGVALDSAGNVYVTDQGPNVIDEFDSAGTFVGQVSGTPSGAFGGPTGVAVSAAGNLYVADHVESEEVTRGVVDVFAPGVVVPDVTIGSVSEPRGTSVTLNGTVNPEGTQVTGCEFEYGTSASYGQSRPCSKPVPFTGNGAEPVSANVTELQSGTTYDFRLAATNVNGTEASTGTFTTPGPTIDEERSTDVSATAAKLHAQIDPNGAETSYFFQYGTTTSYGASVPAPPGVDIGSGTGGQDVAPEQVQGLAPSTIYHYRLVAVQSGEEFDGLDHVFTTQPPGSALTLPDGREWEQVTPQNKQGALILGLFKKGALGLDVGPIQAAADGSAITYAASAPTGSEPKGYSNFAQILSGRGAAGWSSADISTPRDAVTSVEQSEYQFFSSDLSLALIEPFSGLTGHTALLSPHASEATPYVRSRSLCEREPTEAECFLPLFTAEEGFADVPAGAVFDTKASNRLALEGATPDLSHVVVSSSAQLTATPTKAGTPQLYAWSAGRPPGEAVQLVSVLPPSEGGVSISSPRVGGEPSQHSQGSRNAISADGSHVFWRTDTSSGPALYMRDTVNEETIRLDVVQPGALGGGEPQGAWFQVASSDGSKVLFRDTQRLTKASGKSGDAEEDGKGGGDLYECEIVEEAGKDKCDLTDLTPEREGRAAEVQNMVVGASDDGSYVYFVANGVLAAGAMPGNCGEEEPGEVLAPATCNLYVSHEGTTTFIATLSDEDEMDWGGGSGSAHSIDRLTARVSPNGRYAAFMSSRSLTGYDTLDANSGKPDQEVYLFDAQAPPGTSQLVCASCDPSGARPTGVEAEKITNGVDSAALNLADVAEGDGHEGGAQGGFGNLSWVAANLPGGSTLSGLGSNGPSLYQSRLLSDSGRLFFNSSDALAPQDVDGTGDVYEYEPSGVGSCTTSTENFSAGSGGCVDLISSGTSSAESGFLDASENGDDVFFLTSESLVPGDVDTAEDVYDAHVCTTQAPCASAPASPPPCTTGEGCRATPTPQPSIFGAPPSATFSGSGNPTTAPKTAVSKPPAKKSKSLTRAQKLRKALKGCHAKKRGKRRALCERAARKRYGVKQSSTKRKANTSKRGNG